MSDPNRYGRPSRARFNWEEIAEALSEAMWEKEREPRTPLWHSFWDRLTDGGPFPEMPDRGKRAAVPEDGSRA